MTDKAAGALLTIGEVSRTLDLKPHVLRYWEEQFPMLRPLTRAGGRRYYRTGDVDLLRTIDRLLNREGYTIRGARQFLQKGGKAALVDDASADASAVSSPSPSARQPSFFDGGGLDPEVKKRLGAVREALERALSGA